MTSSSKTQTRKTDPHACHDNDGDAGEYYDDNDDDGEADDKNDDGSACMNLRVHLLKQSLGAVPSEEKTKQTTQMQMLSLMSQIYAGFCHLMPFYVVQF